MAAAGSFKRPAAPAQHPPLRACPSRGARGGGLGRSGSSSRVGTGLRVGGGGQKLGLTPVHLSSARASPVTAPRVRWRATGGGGKEEEEAGAASGAELQQRRLLCCGRGAPEVRAWASCGGGGQKWVRVLGSWCGGRVGIQFFRGGGGGDSRMLRTWDGGTGDLDPTPGDRKERGAAEGCGGQAWRPRASRAVVDYVGVKVVRERLKDSGQERVLFSPHPQDREERRVVALSREGKEGQGLMYPLPPPPHLHLSGST